MKKSQISLFFIIGFISVLILGMIYFSVNKNKFNTKTDDTLVLENEANQIKQYIEKCMYDSGFEGMFNYLAPQGGFISPKEDKIETSGYMSYDIAYWNDGLIDISPDMKDAENILAEYVEHKAGICFKDYPKNQAEIDALEPKTVVDFNYDDTQIRMEWPITLTYGNSIKLINSFSIRLPYNFAKDFDIAKKLIKDIIESQPRFYDIYNNCSRYETNGKTTIHVVNYVAEVKNHVQIISIFDYEPIFTENQKTLKFQFAIRNITAMGYCDA